MKEDRIQVRKNLIFNVLSLISNIGIGILYTPYLVKSLGIIAYGVVPLALIINQYVSVVTGSLTSSLTRFYTISIQKNDLKDASKYISTSLLVVIVLLIILVPPLFFLIKNINVVFNIPDDLVDSAKVLFSFTAMSFGLSLLSSVFNITLYAYNRLDYLNVIKIFRVVLKFIFVVVFFTFINVDISYVGIANFLCELFVLLFSVVVFYRFTKGGIAVNFRLFDKASFSVLSLMASWVMVQQLGDTLIYRIDNIIVNKFWSTKESGVLGAFTELGTYSMVVAGVIGSLFGPLILQAYGREDHGQVKSMTLDRSVSVGVIVAVMVGILCGFSPIVLNIWLGEEFVDFNLWLYLKLFLVPFYSAAGVFAFAARAWNKVRTPALATLFLGALNLLLIWGTAAFFNENSNTIPVILLIGLIFGVLQSYFLNGFVFHTLYKGTLPFVLNGALKIFLVLVIVSAIGYILSPFLINLNVVLSLFAIGLIGIVCLVLSLKLALTKEQSDVMIGLVYNKK